MKKFRLHIFTLSQIMLVAGIFSLLLIVLFSANLAVQRASVNLQVGAGLPLVIIDAGHGGEDGGAIGVNGALEKDINLSIAQKTELLLHSLGFETRMTRTDDTLHYDETCTSMREKKVSDIHRRFSMMEEAGDCVFLSIHQNHFTDAKYSGAQVFYGKNNQQSAVLAQALQDAIVGVLQPDNTRQIKPSGTEIYLLYHAEVPAVMVECGFLSNAAEAQKLTDDNYQTELAMCIADGLLQYFNNRM